MSIPLSDDITLGSIELSFHFLICTAIIRSNQQSSAPPAGAKADAKAKSLEMEPFMTAQ